MRISDWSSDVCSSDLESGWSFKPRGRILIDAATVDAPDSIADNGLGFSNEIRRARLGVEGTIPGGFGYKLEADFADNGVELLDAILTYKSKGLNFTFGKQVRQIDVKGKRL